MFLGWNDFELLYLISEGVAIAKDVMFKKYSYLIMQKSKTFNFKSFEDIDYLQEGLIVLNKAILTFNNTYNKSFFKYYEVLLKNRFLRLKEQEKVELISYDLSNCQNVLSLDDVLMDYNIKFDDIYYKRLFEEVYIRQNKIQDVAIYLKKDIKKIYYDIKKLKDILKKYR